MPLILKKCTLMALTIAIGSSGCKPGGPAADPAATEETKATDPTPAASAAPVVASEELGDGSKGFAVVGTLALSLGLTNAVKVTHVVALNTESGTKLAFPVDQTTGKFKVLLAEGDGDGGFSDYIHADGTLDRERMLADHPEIAPDIEGVSDIDVIAMISEDDKDKDPNATPEASPWILAYVDATKTGKEMIVSRFAAETLDTLSPILGSPGLKMGDVTPVQGGKATASASYTEILEATKMSAGAAETFGAIDDVSLRYINPDIDADGVLDSPVLDADGKFSGVQRRFLLDFHNRFNYKRLDGSIINQVELKNVYADELVGGTENLNVVYTGTGIVPELEKDSFAAVPATYKWKFEADVEVQAGGCNEISGAGTLSAGSWCTHTYTENLSYDRFQLSQELKLPPEGTYVLNTAEKELTWTNVKVSDFSGGIGFVILLIKYNVSDKGTTGNTADDTLTGIDYKYLKKTAAGWVPATDEELKLIIKGDGGMLSLKFNSDSLNCGTPIPKKSTGTIVFADVDLKGNSESQAMTDLLARLKAGTELWSDFSSGAASYDDKLGMRFFF